MKKLNKGCKEMENLVVKDVNFNGDMLKAAQDQNGKIWVGVKWICRGIGLTESQANLQRRKIMGDDVFSEGRSNLNLLTNGGRQETMCLKLDYLPLWLAKISITPNMKRTMPEVAKKLRMYQIEAKDVLANAFIDKSSVNVPAQTIQLTIPQDPEYVKKLDWLINTVSELSSKISSATNTLETINKLDDRILKLENKASISQEVKRETKSYKAWKDKMNNALDKIVKSSDKFRTKAQVFQYIYGYITRNYGIVWDQEIKEYRDKYGYSSYITKLDTIYSKGSLRSIFESIVADLAQDCISSKEHDVSLEKMVAPLAAKCNDKTPHCAATFRRVYKSMETDWKTYPNKRKIILIKENKELQKDFENTVRLLMA